MVSEKRWYHWAPTARRLSIKRSGLVPGSNSTDFLWKPPFVCVGPSPHFAWALSGNTPRGREVAKWDLWEVSLLDQHGYEILFYDDGTTIKELRVYERIYKRNVWYVASRSNPLTEK